MIAVWAAFVFGTGADEAHRISQSIFPFAKQGPVGTTRRRFMVVGVSFMLLIATAVFVGIVAIELSGGPSAPPRAPIRWNEDAGTHME
jgi:hypothetical protein